MSLQAVLWVGVAGAIVAAAFLAFLLRSIAVADAFPGLQHGTLRIGRTGMKVTWGLTLLFTYCAGGPEIVSQAELQGMSEAELTALESERAFDPLVARFRDGGATFVRIGPFELYRRHAVPAEGPGATYARYSVRFPLWLLVGACSLLWVTRVPPSSRSRRVGMPERRIHGV